MWERGKKERKRKKSETRDKEGGKGNQGGWKKEKC